MIDRTAAIYTAIVVAIFAVVRFTEGAWLIVIVFPALVCLLIRLTGSTAWSPRSSRTSGTDGRGHPAEAAELPPPGVLIFVDDVDLVMFAAIRYARGLRPTHVRAVHFVIDSAQAEQLREQWARFRQDIPLEMIDTPDRRLTRASLELVSREARPRHAGHRGAAATRLRPAARPAAARPHGGQDRLGDQPVPDSAATIIPFHVERRVHLLHARHAAGLAAARQAPGADQMKPGPFARRRRSGRSRPAPGRRAVADRPVFTDAVAPNGHDRIAALDGGKASIEGRVRSVEIRPVENSCVFEATVADAHRDR